MVEEILDCVCGADGSTKVEQCVSDLLSFLLRDHYVAVCSGMFAEDADTCKTFRSGLGRPEVVTRTVPSWRTISIFSERASANVVTDLLLEGKYLFVGGGPHYGLAVRIILDGFGKSSYPEKDVEFVPGDPPSSRGDIAYFEIGQESSDNGRIDLFVFEYFVVVNRSIRLQIMRGIVVGID